MSAETLRLVLDSQEQAKTALRGLLFPFLANALTGGKRWILNLKPETRSEAQNRLQWPLLECFSKQLEWPVDGRMTRMEPEEWKDVLTAAFRGESVRLAMGLSGGVVLLGQRTSKFTKAQFSEWIDFLYATAADRGVKLPAWTWPEDEVRRVSA